MLKYPNFWNHISIISLLLFPLSLIFSAASFCRKLVSRETNLGFPVICIGNATVGGTGKTPMIIHLAQHYLALDKKVVVITKGYRGNYIRPTIVEPGFEASFVGDEALEISKKIFPKGDATIIASRGPLDCKNLINEIMPDLILVDDCLQNANLKKDFTILMVDGKRGFGNGFLIPAGPLRENYVPAIKKSDIVCSVNPERRYELMLSRTSGDKFIQVNSQIHTAAKEGSRILAFCGLGNPDRFFEDLAEKYEVVKKIAFDDHHNYSQENVKEINGYAKDYSVDYIITTAKDMTKLSNYDFVKKLEVAALSFSENKIKEIVAKIDEKVFKINK